MTDSERPPDPDASSDSRLAETVDIKPSAPPEPVPAPQQLTAPLAASALGTGSGRGPAAPKIEPSLPIASTL